MACWTTKIGYPANDSRSHYDHREPTLTSQDAADSGHYFEGSFLSVREARAALAALPLEGELKHKARLVLSELATNAVLHAGAPFVLRAWYDGHTLRLEVEDTSSRLPSLLQGGVMSGRGLHIVEALSQRWGAELRGDGKVVWAEVH